MMCCGQHVVSPHLSLSACRGGRNYCTTDVSDHDREFEQMQCALSGHVDLKGRLSDLTWPLPTRPRDFTSADTLEPFIVFTVNRTPTHTACTAAHSVSAHHTAQSDHFSSREHV